MDSEAATIFFFYFVLGHKGECDAEWLDQRLLTHSGWIRDFWRTVVGSETSDAQWLDQRLLTQSSWIRDLWRRVVGSATLENWSACFSVTQSFLFFFTTVMTTVLWTMSVYVNFWMGTACGSRMWIRDFWKFDTVYVIWVLNDRPIWLNILFRLWLVLMLAHFR